MRLTIHRGSREIGGSCVELAASTGGRILLDLGMPLVQPDGSDWPRGTATRPTEELLQEGILPDIPGLYGDTNPQVSAVVLSHAHLDHYGLSHHVHPDIPVWGSAGTLAVLWASEVFLPDVKAPTLVREFPSGEQVDIGGFMVTALPVDHAAPDSRALLVEADGQAVLYSGDLRAHGHAGHLFDDLLDNPPTADVLLLEGTVVGQAPGSHGYPREADVEREFTELLGSHSGLVVVVASGQNVDRVVSLYRAAQKTGRELIIDPYQAYVLRALAGLSSGLPQFDWPGIRVKFFHRQVARLKETDQFPLACRMSRAAKVTTEQLVAQPERFVLAARSSIPTVNLLNRLHEPSRTAVVWSLWKGYWSRPNPLRSFCETHGIDPLFIHTGGHAAQEDLQRLAAAVAPRAVVPIHTQHAARFDDLFSRVMQVPDGAPVEISEFVASG